MSIIQRWFFIGDEPYESEENDAEYLARRKKEQWCKAKDVEELERVITERSISHDATIEGLRRQLDSKNVLVGRLQDDVMRLCRNAE